MKTRHSSGSLIGGPCPLPDTGALPTLKDVICAVKNELENSSGDTVREAAKKIEPQIRRKFHECNPLLPLI